MDGFAGAGRYIKGDKVEDGSPVTLAKLAQKVRDDGKPVRIVSINTERSPATCERLKESLAAFSPDVTRVLCGSFASRLPEILKMIGTAPAVFFLDPFGVDGIAPDQILPVLKRPDTEVLINLNTRVLHRLAGSEASDAKAAPRKVNLLSRVLGDRIGDPLPEWLHQWNQLDSQAWQEWAVGRYMELLRENSPSLEYVAAYKVRERHHGGAKYYLVFASRRLDAFPLMTDFICTEEDDLRLQAELEARAPGQMPLFGPAHETERANRIRELAEEIHAYGLKHQGCTRKEIYEQFSYRYLGQFMQKHYRQLLDDLAKEGRLQFGPGKDKHRRPITFR